MKEEGASPYKVQFIQHTTNVRLKSRPHPNTIFLLRIKLGNIASLMSSCISNHHNMRNVAPWVSSLENFLHQIMLLKLLKVFALFLSKRITASSLY